MRIVSGLAIVSAWAGVAEAQADKPVIGPAPAWEKAVAIPAADSKAGDAAIAILLQDQQVALEPGRRTSYSETAIRIQTPQGLAAGNISFPWRPETDVLTIHKLLIRRGSEVIDVLASGQTFTVARRETNLDSAMLDGVLTASIQPEGLQVGDILHFALSVSSSDPVLKGHVEQMAGGGAGTGWRWGGRTSACNGLPRCRSACARPNRSRRCGRKRRMERARSSSSSMVSSRWIRPKAPLPATISAAS